MIGTYHRLNVTVFASNLEVIRAARKKLKREAFKREHRTFRHEFYSRLLSIHADAQRLYFTVAA